METLTKVFPFLFKLVVVVLGGIFSLLLSGDISTNDDNKIVIDSIWIISLKLSIAIIIGLVAGDFLIDYYNFEDMTFYAQSIFNLMASVFGIMVIGTLYRACQLTFTEKSLPDIISEMKNIIKAFTR